MALGGGSALGGGTPVGGGDATGGGNPSGGGSAMGGGAPFGGGSATGGGASTTLLPSRGVCVDGWCWDNPAPLGIRWWAVYAPSDSEAWLVGDAGLTAHFLNGVWTLVPTGLLKRLRGVHGTGPQDVWAVGESGTILHWAGSAWQQVPYPASVPVQQLTTVWAASPTRVYAGAGNYPDAVTAPVMLRYDGNAWSQLGTANSSIMQIAASAPDDAWFVGGLAAVWHWDGMSLTTPFLGQPGHSTSNALWIASSTSMWFGGWGEILHFDGTQWSHDPVGGPRALWGTSDDDIWGVGIAELGAMPALMGPDLFHRSASGWSTQQGPNGQELMSVHGSSPSNVWVSGVCGTAAHFDGGAWATQFPGPSPSLGLILGIWGSSSNDLFAVDENGFVLHFDGGSWSLATRNSTLLRDVRGTAADDVWVAGNDNVMHYDGTGWTDRSNGSDAGAVRLWPVSRDEVWGVDKYDVIRRWTADAGRWNLANPVWGPGGGTSPLIIAALWGSGPSDVYTGGQQRLAHYDGTAWSPMLNDAGITQALHIWGSGPADVYLDDGNAPVWHFDGASWKRVAELDGVAVVDISGSGPDDVWVLDNYLFRGQPRALHWDGATWSEIPVPSDDLYAFFVADPHLIFGAGRCGQILRHTH
jgi:hypothetical protein